MTLPNASDFPSQTQVPGFFWDEEYLTPAFMRSEMPASLWDDRALAHIERHITTEANASSKYEALAKANDPAVKLLAGLIAEDERRHHRVLMQIAEKLRAEVDEIPTSHAHVELGADERDDLRCETRELLEMEKSDALTLKELHRDLRAAPEETMWAVLIEMMSYDTDKHIHLLKAIDRRLRSRRRRVNLTRS